jgi:hypothetical protein
MPVFSETSHDFERRREMRMLFKKLEPLTLGHGPIMP